MEKSLTINQTAILAENAHRIRQVGQEITAGILKVGKLLTESKNICAHGHWLPWLEREFKWGEDTAERYMRVYKVFGSNTVTDRNMADLPQLPDLSLNVLFKLSAPSITEATRKDIISQAKAGKKITASDIKTAVAQTKPTSSVNKKQPVEEKVVVIPSVVKLEDVKTTTTTSGNDYNWETDYRTVRLKADLQQVRNKIDSLTEEIDDMKYAFRVKKVMLNMFEDQDPDSYSELKRQAEKRLK